MKSVLVVAFAVTVLVLATRPLWWPETGGPPPTPAPAAEAPGAPVTPAADPAATWRLLRHYEQYNEPEALQAALTQAGAVLRRDAASLPGWLALGRARDAMQDFQRARRVYARAGIIAPGAAAPDLAAGDTWLADGDLGAALSRMLRASAKAPDELESASRILMLSNALEDFAAADRWAEWLGRRVTRQAEALAALAHHRYLTGSFEQAVQLSNIALRLGLSDRWDADAVFTRIKRDEAIADGGFARAIDLLRERHPALFEPIPRIVPGNIQQAVDLAFLLQQAGQSERAEILLRRAVDAYGAPGFTSGSARTVILPVRAEALALLGEERAALAELDRVVDAGWRLQWRWETDLNANFIALRDAPGFRRIIGRIEADVADQRRRLRAGGET
jgi:tetratricopeptide (TPR) repeat protein